MADSIIAVSHICMKQAVHSKTRDHNKKNFHTIGKVPHFFKLQEKKEEFSINVDDKNKVQVLQHIRITTAITT